MNNNQLILTIDLDGNTQYTPLYFAGDCQRLSDDDIVKGLGVARAALEELGIEITNVAQQRSAVLIRTHCPTPGCTKQHMFRLRWSLVKVPGQPQMHVSLFRTNGPNGPAHFVRVTDIQAILLSVVRLT